MWKSIFEKTKNELPKLECVIVKAEDSIVHIYYFKHNSNAKKLITESKHKGVKSLGETYFATKHKAHTTKGEYHLHIYDGQNQIESIYKSGSTHDNFHKTILPSSVVSALKKRFPDFVIPSNGLLESALNTYSMLQYYTEQIDELYRSTRNKLNG